MLIPFKCDVHSWMHAYVGVVESSVLRGHRQRRQVRAEDRPAGHLHDRSRGTRSSARQTQTVTLGEKDAKEITFTFKVQRRGSRNELDIDAGTTGTRKLVTALHRPADRGRRHGDEHGVGPLGARLADDVRLEHVHVSDEQVGRRHPLRAQPPADREHRRLPDDHPGGLDVAGRAAPLGPQARIRRARRGDPAGVLGGITVLFFLPPAVSIGHAGLAQIFFCLTLTLALVTSPGWKNAVASGRRSDAAPRRGHHDRARLHADPRRRDDAAQRRGPGDSGLPAGVRPRDSAGVERADCDPFRASSRRAGRHARHPRDGEPRLLPPPAAARTGAAGALLLVAGRRSQVTLGAFVVWSGKNPFINTAHVVNGALVLGTSLVLTLRSVSGRRSSVWSSRSVARGSDCRDSGHGAAERARESPTPSRIAGVRAPAPRDFVALAKPRLNLLVVASTLVGYAMAAGRAARARCASADCCWAPASSPAAPRRSTR